MVIGSFANYAGHFGNATINGCKRNKRVIDGLLAVAKSSVIMTSYFLLNVLSAI